MRTVYRLTGPVPVVQLLCWLAQEHGQSWQYLQYTENEAALFAPASDATRRHAEYHGLQRKAVGVISEQIAPKFSTTMLTSVVLSHQQNQETSTAVLIQPAQVSGDNLQAFVDHLPGRGHAYLAVLLDTASLAIAEAMKHKRPLIAPNPQAPIVYLELTRHQMVSLRRLGCYVRRAAGIPHECIPYGLYQAHLENGDATLLFHPEP